MKQVNHETPDQEAHLDPKEMLEVLDQRATKVILVFKDTRETKDLREAWDLLAHKVFKVFKEKKEREEPEEKVDLLDLLDLPVNGDRLEIADSQDLMVNKAPKEKLADVAVLVLRDQKEALETQEELESLVYQEQEVLLESLDPKVVKVLLDLLVHLEKMVAPDLLEHKDNAVHQDKSVILESRVLADLLVKKEPKVSQDHREAVVHLVRMEKLDHQVYEGLLETQEKEERLANLDSKDCPVYLDPLVNQESLVKAVCLEKLEPLVNQDHVVNAVSLVM